MKLLALALLLVCLPAKAETWLVVPLASLHAPRGDYEQINPGIGFERAYSARWSLGAGYYRNSHRGDSFYAGASYTPLRLAGWGLGTSLGLVSGYRGVIPMIAPTVSYTYGGVGFSVLIAPPIRGKTMAGFTLRFRL